MNNNHECTSNCRRNGCPNCPHGKSEEQFCGTCDNDGTTDHAREYTAIRRFYAWTGFLAITIALIWGVYSLASMKRAIDIINESNAPQEPVLGLWYAGTRKVTAYTLGRVEETDGSPCIGAYNDNLCEIAKKGIRVCASNEFPKGTKLIIGDNLECVVMDRLNARYPTRVDIADLDYEASSRFGLQVLEVFIEK